MVAGLGNASGPCRNEPGAFITSPWFVEDIVPADRCRLSGGGILKSKVDCRFANDESPRNAGLGNRLEGGASE